MTTSSLHDRIAGSLLLAGMGDALGAPTEQWSMAEILAAHGGLVTGFVTPTVDTFAGANAGKRAEVTDDASQMYYLARALVRGGGSLDAAGWVACLLDWADTSPKAGFMGPSTVGIVAALRAGTDPALVGVIGQSRRKMTTIGTTNGAAMRVAPAGLVHPGDLDAACAQALVTCLPSHDTDVAIAAACAIAAGTARALVTDDIAAVITACIEGGRQGATLAARHARVGPGPRFQARLDLALEIAARATDDLAFLDALDARVGASVLAAESVPAAIAILAYAKGDPLRTIALSATIGNDTDSIATMAGALAGALCGVSALPAGLTAEFRAVNAADYGLDALAVDLAAIAQRRLAA
ncbi:ADP-ribosylglycohydrolase [Nitrospirillum amazonense]|uniref:ADP-ribosylglycohydrolase n=1 Tax=Nitrospirillum amazonense TaxID=28077 RepID=A0A560FJI0_9PROT|nr:ADP-ribosylglycohydrolase family protein [Nitrospirillum amazonense]TWB21759.1 ADP-ribosylglycohydrolase [Nitrospirillum amazonense]